MNITYFISQNNYMVILLKIVVIVYYVTINLYGFFIIRFRKKTENLSDCENRQKETKITDGKLFVTGALGGALGIYLAMFIFRFRLTNLPFIVLMPVLITINIYLIISGFSNNFWISPQAFVFG